MLTTLFQWLSIGDRKRLLCCLSQWRQKVAGSSWSIKQIKVALIYIYRRGISVIHCKSLICVNILTPRPTRIESHDMREAAISGSPVVRVRWEILTCHIVCWQSWNTRRFRLCPHVFRKSWNTDNDYLAVGTQQYSECYYCVFRVYCVN